ncbi:MAG: class I SAM-dependent methyltransferase [Alphaproteobacteria bacterium]|nr:class I SAM-dependent methyltransferase [Alphaproteobacteria bacterium]
MGVAPDDRWVRYYDAVAGRPPRDTLLRALASIEAEGRPTPDALALDLGAGEGRDTVELLRRGYRVIAIDVEPRAFERLRGRPDLVRSEALETVIGRFEDLELPESDLINASFSLPFCTPRRFPQFWRRLVTALKPGGRFAGQLLGVRDDWATKGDDVTAFEADAAQALLGGLLVECFEEEETDSATATGKPKHWHLFHIVAKKPAG